MISERVGQTIAKYSPEDIESQMLKYFQSNVSVLSREKLFDKNAAIPFANLQYPRKRHGLKRQRVARNKKENIDTFNTTISSFLTSVKAFLWL